MGSGAVGGIITELIALRLLYPRQKGNLNMKGAFWHIIQTFVGSILIIISALVIRFTGFLEIDPLLGMAFGVISSTLLISLGVPPAAASSPPAPPPGRVLLRCRHPDRGRHRLAVRARGCAGGQADARSPVAAGE